MTINRLKPNKQCRKNWECRGCSCILQQKLFRQN